MLAERSHPAGGGNREPGGGIYEHLPDFVREFEGALWSREGATENRRMTLPADSLTFRRPGLLKAGGAAAAAAVQEFQQMKRLHAESPLGDGFLGPLLGSHPTLNGAHQSMVTALSDANASPFVDDLSRRNPPPVHRITSPNRQTRQVSDFEYFTAISRARMNHACSMASRSHILMLTCTLAQLLACPCCSIPCPCIHFRITK